MPCDTRRVDLTEESQRRLQKALDRLEEQLQNGSAQVVVGPTGSIAFRGWEEREGWADVCAYRRLQLSGSATLRQATARAQVMAGRTIDERQISAGVHSHDGGQTWGRH